MSRQHKPKNLFTEKGATRTVVPRLFLYALPLICGFLVLIWEWLAVFYLFIAFGVYVAITQTHLDLGLIMPSRYPAGSIALSIGIGLALVSSIAYLSTPDQQTMYVPDLATTYSQYTEEEPAEGLSLASQGLIALVEELFFRGAVMANYLYPAGPLVAIPVSAVVFASAHVLTGAYIATAIGGVVFGVQTWLAKSILPAITSHITYNVCVLGVSYDMIDPGTVNVLAVLALVMGAAVVFYEYAEAK